MTDDSTFVPTLSTDLSGISYHFTKGCDLSANGITLWIVADLETVNQKWNPPPLNNKQKQKNKKKYLVKEGEFLVA